MKYLTYRIRGLLFLLWLLPLAGYSQSSTAYYYYYKGEKILLEVNTKTIALVAEGASNAETLKSLLSDSNPAPASIQADYTRSKLIPIDQQAVDRKAVKTYYAEVATPYTNEAAYNRQIAAYRNMPAITMASPCFQTKEGKKIGLSNNFYVQLKTKEGVDALYETAKQLSIEVLGHNKFMPLWFTLSCGKDTKLNALEAANLFYETGAFENTEPAFILHDLLSSSDTYFNDQWGLKNTGQYGSAYSGIDIKAEQAWTITTGSSAVKTFVLDEGFEMNHPDLQANVWGTGFNAVTGTSPSQVYGPHGTACAGIIGAVQNNSLGISGVAPNSKITSVSINYSLSTYQDYADGINWSYLNGADIISNSWGGGSGSSAFDNAVTNALTYGRGGKGTVIVFSTANANGAVSYPASSNPLILAVGAASPCGERKNPGSCDGENWWGSNYGAQLDIMAPGVKIPTTDRQSNTPGDYNPGLGRSGDYTDLNYTKWFNGTSAACPHVAGVAALVLSVNPNLSVQQVNDIIEQTAQKVRTNLYSYSTATGRPNGTWNNEMGYGLVDAYQAVTAATALGCPANLTITTNVTAPNTDYKQASGTITASNNIGSGATAIYHASDEVVLATGFEATSGSSFGAYIEGCTGNYQLRLQAPPVNEMITYDFRPGDTGSKDTKPALTTSSLLVSPNPFTSKLTINYYLTADNSKADIAVYSITGVKVADLLLDKQTVSSSHSTEWNAEGLPGGMYLIVLTTDSGKEVKRVVKK
jgi:subtilisin family serine protease